MVWVGRLHGVSDTNIDAGYGGAKPEVGRPIHEAIYLLQRSLYHRSVSVASDEPICVATLLSLDIRNEILEGQSPPRLMARIWELIAAHDGGIASRIIFYVDNPIPLLGWRWAPMSLLRDRTDRESAIAYGEIMSRFYMTGQDFGQITDLGLKVKFRGKQIKVESWRSNFPADEGIWDGLVKHPEENIHCHDPETGKWYSMANFYKNRVVQYWAEEELDEWNAKNPQPLFAELSRGRVALIQEPDTPVQLIVRYREIDEYDDSPAVVDACRTVTMYEHDAVFSQGLDITSQLVTKVANHQLTTDLLKIENKFSDEYEAKLIEIKEHIKAEVKAAFETRPEFRRFGEVCFGIYRGEHMWSAVVYTLRRKVIVRDMPEDQTWIVDKCCP
jgi:hypothetical protein